jgi:hypothetical protein
METIKCSMCRSSWGIEFREQYFNPGKKTCIECSIRAYRNRIHKSRYKKEAMIDDILEDEPDDRMFNINQVRYFLFLFSCAQNQND